MREIGVAIGSLLLVAAVAAEEMSWKATRPAASAGTAVALGRPQALAASRSLADAVALGAPIPVPADSSPTLAIHDPHVQRSVFHSERSRPRIVRGQTPEAPSSAVVVTGAEPDPAFVPPADESLVSETFIHDTGWYAEPFGPPGRFYASADYLLWWLKNNPAPPLVTTGPPGSFGFLGQPGVVVLFGNGDISDQLHSGGRFTAGCWFDDCLHCWGIEGSYFFLGETSRGFLSGCVDDDPTLIARPFFNVNPIRGIGEDSQLVCAEGLADGIMTIEATTRLWGAEGNVRRNLCQNAVFRCDALVGFRYLDLDDNLQIAEAVFAPQTGAVGRGFDSFSTRNQFYGGQVGAVLETRLTQRLFLECRPKIAFGVTDQDIDIDGGLRLTQGGVTTFHRGLLLALPSNIGHYHSNVFAVVPEIGINLAYQLTDHLRARVGYTFLYWSSVVRSGDQIDRFLNAALIPGFGVPLAGPIRPLNPFQQTDFWAQGVNFGLELTW
jgi:hypothetical protein